MKIAIISDIHGNYPALRAVLADIGTEEVDEIYCLGDLVGYYCMINEVIGAIREFGIASLMGNHDYALIHNHGIIERSKTCTKILNRQLEDITDSNFRFLSTCRSSFVFSIGTKSVFCVHGGLEDPIDEYIMTIDEDYLERNNFKYDILISGHTHIPRNEDIGPKKYLNPGSVGQPRDGNPAASYLVLSENNYKFKRVKYPVQEIVLEMKKKNYEPYIYKGLYTGVKVGG